MQILKKVTSHILSRISNRPFVFAASFAKIANQEAQCGGALDGKGGLQTAWDLQYLAMISDPVR